MKKKTPNFQRTKFRAYVKLGSRQKSKQKYTRATGRHNKTRQKWKSRPKMVEIGYKNKVVERGLIYGKTPVVIRNIIDIQNVGKNMIAIIGNIGMKKKIEVAKEIIKRNIEVANLNVKKFLRKVERIKSHKARMKESEKEKARKAEEKNKAKEAKQEAAKQEEAKHVEHEHKEHEHATNVAETNTGDKK